jgi:hypothetical protein
LIARAIPSRKFGGKLDSLLEIFTDDVHKKRTRTLLNRRIETLLCRLEQIADGNA